MLLSTLIFIYAVVRIQIMSERSDDQYIQSVTDSYFTEEPFTTEDGFNVAFALSAYDSEQEFIEDPDYGTLKAYHYEWGFEES